MRIRTQGGECRIPDAEVVALALRRKQSGAANRALKELFGVEVVEPGGAGAPARLRVAGAAGPEEYEMPDVERFRDVVDAEMDWFKQPINGLWPLEITGRLASKFKAATEAAPTVAPEALADSVGAMFEHLLPVFRGAVERCFPLEGSTFKSRVIPVTSNRDYEPSSFAPAARDGGPKPVRHENSVLALRSPRGDEYALQLKLEEGPAGWLLRCTPWRSMFERHVHGDSFEFHGSGVREVERGFLAALEDDGFRATLESSIETLARRDLAPVPLQGAPDARISRFFQTNSAGAPLRNEVLPLAEALENAFQALGGSFFPQSPRAAEPKHSLANSLLNRRLVAQDGPAQYELWMTGSGSYNYPTGSAPRGAEKTPNLSIVLELSRAAYGERKSAPPIAASASSVEGLIDRLGLHHINKAESLMSHLGNVVRSGAPGKRAVLMELEARLGLESNALEAAIGEMEEASAKAGEPAPTAWKNLLYQHEREGLAEAVDLYNGKKHAAQVELETRMGLLPGALDAAIAKLEKAEASLEADKTEQDWWKVVKAFKAEQLEGMRAEHSQQMSKLEAALASAGEGERGAALKQAVLESNLGEVIRRELEVLRLAPIRFETAL